MSGSGISWATCKSAPRFRQITTPAPHHSVFYRPYALPAAQSTASQHWRCNINSYKKTLCTDRQFHRPRPAPLSAAAWTSSRQSERWPSYSGTAPSSPFRRIRAPWTNPATFPRAQTSQRDNITSSVAEWLACWTQAQKGRVQIAAAALSGNSLRQTVYTHCASVHQAAKLVAALLRVAGVTAGLAAESIGWVFQADKMSKDKVTTYLGTPNRDTIKKSKLPS